jgi:hypothetical protein
MSPEPSLERTPTLERLLAATRRALVRQVCAYGVGTLFGIVTLWLSFAFLADWGLRVPFAIRVMHGCALLAWIGIFLWRDLLRPLRKLPDSEGLALLYERTHPELKELLISAVQFQGARAARAGDPALVAEVVAAAEARAATLAPPAVIDPEAPRARLLLGGGGILALGVLAALNPQHARTFLVRLCGGSASWPQRTHLTLEIPGLDPGTVVERSPELLRLRLARGSDVALLVTAEGEAPDEVTVHFDGGRDLVLNPTGERVFRTLLQSCQDDLAFHVTGGDDEAGRPRVEIEVLEPPDVEGLAIVVDPPEYAGLGRATYFGQDVEVLRGSHVEVHVLPAPRGATGLVRFLPDDTTAPLTPAPFPLAQESAPSPAPAPGAAPIPPEPGLVFACTPDRTLGFRVELVDANGLTNPAPGLTRIRVVEDRAPELAVLAPTRGEFETVRGGAVPLRVRAEDDFALASLGWRLRVAEDGKEPAAPLRSEELEPKRLTPAEAGPKSARSARDIALGSARLEIDSLGVPDAKGTPAAVAVDSRFELEFFARDRRAPEPNEGRSAAIRLRIVTPEELLRRLQDRLAESRIDALRLSDDQRAKRKRIEELLDALDGDAPLDPGEDQALAAVLAGERRVLGSAQALARALAGAAEDVLYARLDDKAAGLLEFYDARASQARDARFQPETWRALAQECAAGRLPSEGFAATLVKLVGLALEISEDHATQTVAALDAAQEASARPAVADNLQKAGEQAMKVEQSVEVLLAELSEWDNFQNVLTLARDILNRQKALRERTQQIATDKSDTKK